MRTLNVIRQRKQERETRKDKFIKNENVNNRNDSNSIMSFLDYLLEVNEEDSTFTLNQVKDEMNTMFAAGFDTVSSSLLFTLILLAKNPEKQGKLYLEMKTIFSNSKRDVDREDLDRMPYCDAVINESLRLVPPVPLVLRLVDKKIELASYTVAKGDICLTNIFGIGQSKRLWGEDAACFRPERWLEGIPANATLATFNLGKRACIGKKYAITIMKIMLVHCVRELVFVGEDQELDLNYEIVLKPNKGHLLQVKKRKKERIQ